MLVNANDDEQMGANLRTAREDRRISQTALAEEMRAAGFDHWRQTTVSRVERGAQRLRLSEVIALEKLVGPLGRGVARPPAAWEALTAARDAAPPANTSEAALIRRVYALEDALAGALTELRAIRAEVEGVIDGKHREEA